MQFDDDQEVAVKCDLCHERLENNEAPACSKTCPTGCIFWGDTKTLSERIEKEVT
jgi:Fe-S-cluster-containing dehydrogenase component